eukprot:SAG31_NODE_2790_length_5089_cov_1.785772_1_plen_690_part_00
MIGALGGFAGLVYAQSNRGAKRLEAFGGPGLTAWINAIRGTYLRRRYPEIATQEFALPAAGEVDECWRDGDFVVIPVVLHRQIPEYNEPDRTLGSPSTDSRHNVGSQKRKRRRQERDGCPCTSESQPLRISYICHLAGNNNHSPTTIVVVDAASTAQAEELLDHSAFHDLQSGSAGSTVSAWCATTRTSAANVVVVHLTPVSVRKCLAYRTWAARFRRESTVHLAFVHESRPQLHLVPAFKFAAKMQTKLSVIDPESFPLPYCVPRSPSDLTLLKQSHGQILEDDSWLILGPGVRFENPPKQSCAGGIQGHGCSTGTSDSLFSDLESAKCIESDMTTMLGLKAPVYPASYGSCWLDEADQRCFKTYRADGRIADLAVQSVAVAALRARLSNDRESYHAMIQSSGLHEELARRRGASHTDNVCCDRNGQTRPLYSYLEEHHLPQSAPEFQQSVLLPPFQLDFFGTGCAEPSRLRNSSAIFCRIDTVSMLLDAGEGCYGGFVRRFGPAADAVVGSLSCIWISHMHADHHAGLLLVLSIATKYRSANKDSLLVVGPTALASVLSAQSKIEFIRYQFCSCANFNLINSKERRLFLASNHAIRGFHSVPVDHCPDAWGLVLHFDGIQSMTLVYSGDTRPCAALAKVAQQQPQTSSTAIILVHEATFWSAEQQHAQQKRHSVRASLFCLVLLFMA